MLRIPYRLGLYSNGFDGRIDDSEAGWKGRGLWVSSGDRTPWLNVADKDSLGLMHALPRRLTQSR